MAKSNYKGFDTYNINTLVYKRAKRYIENKSNRIVRHRAAKYIIYGRRTHTINYINNIDRIIRQAYCAAYLDYTLELGILDNLKHG